MAVLKCKMCGGDLNMQEGVSVCECEYCGSKQTVPIADNEKKLNLFARANRLRFNCEFDKASGIYESIVSEFPEEAEAYWGLLLCKYGIEYVDDPATGKKIPTCHRSSFKSVMEDENFELACEYADATAKRVYREQAKEIEELRKGIIEVSSKEEPYDIFICYKETDENGDRTLDSVLAHDIYTALTEKGYRVFFSRITLEDKLGQEYEPYIFAALHSAKVMLAVGTEYEYYDAVWVKNEWSRYLQLIASGEKKTLIPCYKNLDAYDMPKEFARLQAQDLGKLGAIQDLIRGIGKILGVKNQAVAVETENRNTGGNALTQRGMLELEEGEFKTALDYFERALDQDPSDAVAYLGKFLSTYGFRSLSDLKESQLVFDIDEEKDFRWAMRFAKSDMLSEMQEVKELNSIKIDRGRLVYILKKYTKKKHESELEAKRKEIQDKENAIRNTISKTLGNAQAELLCDEEGCVKKAKEICKGLLEDHETAMRFRPYYEAFIDSLSCKKAILDVLKKTIDPLSVTEIREIPPAHKYSLNNVRHSIEELVKYGTIEEDSPYSYQMIGAAEARKQRAEKKAAYDKYVEEMNEIIHKELDPLQKDIIEKYSVKRHALTEEMDNKIEDIKKERELLENQKRQYEAAKANLGLFKGKEKREYADKIDAIETKLAHLPSEGTISKEYYAKIKEVDEKEELNNLEKSIMDKYPIKTYEEFQLKQTDISVKKGDVEKEIDDESKEEAERQIKKAEHTKPKIHAKKVIGEIVAFGQYEQGNGVEPIQWVILDKSDNKVFLLSRDALDVHSYHASAVDIDWKTCALRKWLNKEFIQTAFDNTELQRIVTTDVVTERFCENGKNEDVLTKDQVFLLSTPEIEKLFPTEQKRQCQPTLYATNKAPDAQDENGNCAWWLRSSGYIGKCASYVDLDGKIGDDSLVDDDEFIFVRPAMWVDI